MYMNEIVSVIIPNYNGVDTIRRCIDSVQNQSYKNIEIIVIDSKSTDNSVEIIKRGYSNVVLIENPYNAGWGIACNIGIREAKTDFVLILNPDVVLERNALEEIFLASSQLSNFSIIAPLEIKYPNYNISKNNRPNTQRKLQGVFKTNIS